jgi:hypothetical protein
MFWLRGSTTPGLFRLPVRRLIPELLQPRSNPVLAHAISIGAFPGAFGVHAGRPRPPA